MRINKKVMTIVAGVVALMALSSTGGAVAGGLITTKHIKDGAVTSAKVKNGTLTLKDFKSSERAKLVGPRGPQGIAGLTGVSGPVGPSGTANLTQVVSPTVTIPAGEIGTVIASCPAGQKVTGGGYFSSIAIAASSQPTGSTTAWGSVIDNSFNTIPVEVQAYAICV